MWRSLRNGVLICLAIITVFLLPAIYAQIKRFALDHSDHARILAGCRDRLVNRTSYRNDCEEWGCPEQNEVVMLRPLPDNVPEAIRRLHPSVIQINNDRVIISFTAPFARVGLIGFSSGARQFGTYEYIDGLWYWDGNDSTKQEKEFQPDKLGRSP